MALLLALVMHMKLLFPDRGFLACDLEPCTPAGHRHLRMG